MSNEPLRDWLALHESNGNLRFVEQRNGIDVYELLRSPYDEVDDEAADAKQ